MSTYIASASIAAGVGAWQLLFAGVPAFVSALQVSATGSGLWDAGTGNHFWYPEGTYLETSGGHAENDGAVRNYGDNPFNQFTFSVSSAGTVPESIVLLAAANAAPPPTLPTSDSRALRPNRGPSTYAPGSGLPASGAWDLYGLFNDAVGTYGDNTGSAALTLTFTAAPPPPVVVAVGQCSTVLLTWGAVAGVTGYNVYKDGVLLADVGSATTRTDTGLGSGTTHTYTVRSYWHTAEGADSNTVSYTVSTSPPAAPVIAISPGGNQGCAVPLTWPAQGNTMGFFVFRAWIDVPTGVSIGTATPGTAQLVQTITDAGASGWTDTPATGLGLRQSYAYYVVAFNACFSSSQSNTVRVTTGLDAPVLSVGTPTQEAETVLNWTAVTGAAAYDLWRARDWGADAPVFVPPDADGGPAGPVITDAKAPPDVLPVRVYSGPLRTFADTGVRQGDRYAYVVVARASCGCSAMSNEVYFVPEPLNTRQAPPIGSPGRSGNLLA